MYVYVYVAVSIIIICVSAAPVAILNDDRELEPGAIINSYRSYFTNQLALNLRCFSIVGHSELEWRTRNIEALPDILDLNTAATIDELNISYSGNAEGRDVGILYQPVSDLSSGYYVCRSAESGYEVEIIATQTNPIWEFLTPHIYDVPLGAEATITVRYADFSYGYVNFGLGFTYELKYIPANENESEVILDTGNTDSDGSMYAYSFLVEMQSTGVYQLRGKSEQCLSMSKVLCGFRLLRSFLFFSRTPLLWSDIFG